MSDTASILVGGMITGVREMTENEAKLCGFELPFGSDGPPRVLCVKPFGATHGAELTIVPSRDPEGNGPGCLWAILPSGSVPPDEQVIYV